MTRICVGPTVTVAGIEITPIEELSAQAERHGPVVAAGGSKAPVAVLIRTAHGRWAYDMHGRPADPDVLLRRYGGD